MSGSAPKAVPPTVEPGELQVPLGDMYAQRWFRRNRRPFNSQLPSQPGDPKFMNTYFLTNEIPNVRDAHPWYPVIPLELELGSLRLTATYDKWFMRFAGEFGVQLSPGVFLKLANLDRAGGEAIVFNGDYYNGAVKVYTVGNRDDSAFKLRADIKWVGLGMRFDAVGLDLLDNGEWPGI